MKKNIEPQKKQELTEEQVREIVREEIALIQEMEQQARAEFQKKSKGDIIPP